MKLAQRSALRTTFRNLNEKRRYENHHPSLLKNLFVKSDGFYTVK